jgi:hypothetical protein
MPLDLTLVVVAATDVDLALFRPVETDGAEMRLIVNDIGESLAGIANRELDASQRAVFGLCHADTVFEAGSLAAFTRTAQAGVVCGLVGADMAGIYHCCYKPNAAWRAGGPGTVSTLDAMGVFFRRDLLRFDAEIFDGFHCHVEDLCLQAAARGIPVLVPPAAAHHRNHDHTREEWQAQYQVYRQRLIAKWEGTEFRTT